MIDQGLQDRFDDCHEQVHHYQSFFPHIPTMKSSRLVELMKQQEGHHQSPSPSPSLVLVDARTRDEQEVSMIPGSLTLDEFHERMDRTMYRSGKGGGFVRRRHDHHQQHHEDNNHHHDSVELADKQEEQVRPGRHDEELTDNDGTAATTIPEDAIVVIYCTVGYRSGREAQHLMDQYPDFFRTYTHPSPEEQDGGAVGNIGRNDDDDENSNNTSYPLSETPNEGPKLFNLDGILAYTYVPDAPPLQIRTRLGTKSVTKQVHVYGPTWNLAHPDYQPIWFRTWDFSFHALQTIGCSVTRSIQHAGCLIKKFLTCNGCRKVPSSSPPSKVP